MPHTRRGFEAFKGIIIPYIKMRRTIKFEMLEILVKFVGLWILLSNQLLSDTREN